MAETPRLPNRPAAMIFDFDGVILDSAEIKAQAFAEIYRDHGPDWVNRILEYQRLHGGVSRRSKFIYFDELILGRRPGEDRLSDLSKQFSDIVLSKIFAAAFISGAQELLDAAVRQSQLFIVSGTPQKELQEIVQQRKLDRYFEAVLGAPTTKVEAFTSIIKTGHFDKDTVLAVGDSITECLAALEVGIAFLGIRAGPSPTVFPEGIVTLPDLVDARALLGF